MRLKKVCLEPLAEAGTSWDEFNVRRQCIPGTWPSDGKGFVSYMKPSAWNDEVAAHVGPKPGVVTVPDEFWQVSWSSAIIDVEHEWTCLNGQNACNHRYNQKVISNLLRRKVRLMLVLLAYLSMIAELVIMDHSVERVSLSRSVYHDTNTAIQRSRHRWTSVIQSSLYILLQPWQPVDRNVIMSPSSSSLNSISLNLHRKARRKISYLSLEYTA